MTTTIPYYGMFTDAGNLTVATIVESAKRQNLAWLEVYQQLVHLSRIPEFGEATDTMVREIVYDALNLTEDFYV